jgi:serine/threonine protein kinase
MTPERWQQIQDVLEKALELAPEQRPAYLHQACSSDPSLRLEVEALLASSDGVRSSFLQSRPSALRVPLAPGTKLGEYEIKSLIGSGGMGEVYRARDSRLGRDVAIKVLPSSLTADSNRLRRFEHEAQAAAALNHPNILAVFQMGTHEGAPYLVAELLEGETLREQITRGQAPLRKAIDSAMQIARGLAAAHEKGIVHRDLKPENIFVTKDGRVKILDFGLAKLTQAQSGSQHDAPRPTEGTEAGVVMGTVGYMSPEQVRGEKADSRADIFAFGAILYEMLAGKRAFQKTTSPETMTAILNEDPQGISQIAKDKPALQRVVHRCLEKNPEQRFQSASDLAFALDTLTESPGSTAAFSNQQSREISQLRAVAAVLALVVVVALVVRFRSQLYSEPKRELRERALTAVSSDNIVSSSLSRDGKFLAYNDRLGDLFLQEIATGETRALSSGPDKFNVTGWFPDGTHLLVNAEGAKSGTWKMSTWDGTTRKISNEDGGYFSPDSRHIFVTKGDGIWSLDIETGEEHLMVRQEAGDYLGGSDWSPSGRRVAFVRSRPPGKMTIETCSVSGTDCTTVLSETRLHGPNGFSDLIWLPDGRVVFALYELAPNQQTSNIWTLSVDPDTGRPLGKPARVTNWVGFQAADANLGSFAHSADGRRFVFIKTRTQNMVEIAELDAGTGKLGTVRRLTNDNWHDDAMAWTRDSKAVLFVSERTGRMTTYKQPVTGTSPEVLISGPENYNFPIFTPDGSWLFYTAYSGGFLDPNSSRLMRRPAEGGPSSVVLLGKYSYDCAAPPSKVCVLGEITEKRLVFASLDPVRGRGPNRASVELALDACSWSLSPDGKSIALARYDDSGISIVSLENGTVKQLQPKNWKGFQFSRWSPDGRSIYVGAQRVADSAFTIFATDLAGNTKVLVEVPENQGWLANPLPSPDGHFLAFTERTYENNVAMLENF